MQIRLVCRTLTVSWTAMYMYRIFESQQCLLPQPGLTDARPMNGSDPDCTTLRCMHPVKDVLLAGWLMDMTHEAFTGQVQNSHDSELTKDLTLEACLGKLFSLFRQAVQPHLRRPGGCGPGPAPAMTDGHLWHQLCLQLLCW